ncbi:MAG TPA: hypothetical protein VK071_11190, partial [Tissierellales bacterium]|nr:hypothetical protein [Tissierellales bacterium]
GVSLFKEDNASRTVTTTPICTIIISRESEIEKKLQYLNCNYIIRGQLNSEQWYNKNINIWEEFKWLNTMRKDLKSK